MYTGHRQDRHYYGLFGFLAAKEEDVREHSKKPESDVRIHQALKWLKGHNHLYSEFYSNCETLYRYQERPSILNPRLIENQQFTYDDLLQQEALGMIFPPVLSISISFQQSTVYSKQLEYNIPEKVKVTEWSRLLISSKT